MDGYIFDYRLGYIRAGCALPGFDRIGDDGAPRRIVTLGGYTTPDMAQSGLSWAHSLSRQIVDRAHTLAIRTGETVQILNGCTDGYASPQILMQCMRDAILLKPEQIVCLSGFYGIAYRLGLVRNRADAAILRTHPFTTPGQLRFMRKITTKRGLDNDAVYYGATNSLSAGELWLRQMAEISCLCDEFGLGFVSFLQPCVFSGQYRRSEEENIFLRKNYGLADDEIERFQAGFQREYDYIAGHAKDLEYIHDLSGIFDDCENVYTDACHVKDAFLPKLTERML